MVREAKVIKCGKVLELEKALLIWFKQKREDKFPLAALFKNEGIGTTQTIYFNETNVNNFIYKQLITLHVLYITDYMHANVYSTLCQVTSICTKLLRIFYSYFYTYKITVHCVKTHNSLIRTNSQRHLKTSLHNWMD